MKVRSLLLGFVAAVATVVSAPAVADAAADGGPVMSPAIVGGSPASQTYSFMASLQSTSGGHFCGGSLIKANWIVTAAHCVQGRSAASIQVRVGTTNRTSGGTLARVSRVIVHPSYRTSYDIALLQLSSSVTQAPVAIAASSGATGQASRIIGWGQTCPAAGGCGAPVQLQQLDTSVVADSRCGGISGSIEICTNNPGGRAGACYGDSGGPQVISAGGGWQLTGATSRSGGGSQCAQAPSIYTDVVAHRSWIQGYTGAL
ncbi:S1 family peptidase [Actinokineospora enzanensis]|uniref:S1 family peptidase n=1 Tax=Actinokineospora enzanensis TaxID=155975 RepID=UPI000376FA67|nr:serine protease [Actinokineospora enzanensis]